MPRRVLLTGIPKLMVAVCTIHAAMAEQSDDREQMVYEHIVAIDRGDTPAQIIAKAAQVVPNRQQRLYHLDEFSGFIHFGPNTFSGVEWGTGKEDPTVFSPRDVPNTDQWCRVMKDAGMRKVIITVKHHDGFCLWQTKYNDFFSVTAIPWQDGEGDVLRDLSASCAKHGLKLRVYLSPADLFQTENEEHGVYGNRSKPRTTVIPTDPESINSNPRVVRDDRPEGAPTFIVEVDDYNRYFLNQLYELLTEYGPIHEVWFDGAHPKRKGGQTYMKSEWYAMIRELAPDAAIFGGPDIRWCGNEAGDTRESEWNVLPTQSEEVSGVDRPDQAPASAAALQAKTYTVYGQTYAARELRYMISEVDTSIRAGWFWRNEREQAVRGPDDVFDIYERSVGGNAGFLLNVPPNRNGRIATRDAECLAEVGRRIRATYEINLLDGAEVESAPSTVDGDLSTYWQSEARSGELLIQLPQPRKINRFIIQEAVFEVGQRIGKHALDAWVDGEWQEVAEATTVGYKRILRFSPVNTDRMRLLVIESRALPTIAELSAHFYQQPPLPVLVSRQADGHVVMSLEAPKNDFNWKRHGKPKDLYPFESTKIVYALDDTDPTLESSVYSQPLVMPRGGAVRARSVCDGVLGSVARVMIGLPKQAWSVEAVSSQQGPEHTADKAVDGDPRTYWHAPTDSGQARSAPELVLDLGEVHPLGGLTYLPPQRRRADIGLIESGRVDVSLDGQSWESAGEFSFGNVVNDPTQRTHRFGAGLSARYVRVTVATTAGGAAGVAAAEFGLLPAGTE